MAWTSPATATAGTALAAAWLNTYLRDNLRVIGDAMTSYTPTYTNFTLGNGTVSAQYAAAGKWVRYKGVITLGSTSAVTGTIRISLPVTALWTTAGYPIDGVCSLRDTSAPDRKHRVPVHQSGTEFYMADLSDGVVNATVPWTWAASDTIAWSLHYEAA